MLTEKCVDKDASCPSWSSFCGSNPYVIKNCLLTCDPTCSGGCLEQFVAKMILKIFIFMWNNNLDSFRVSKRKNCDTANFNTKLFLV